MSERFQILILILALLSFSTCSGPNQENEQSQQKDPDTKSQKSIIDDPHSYAKPWQAVIDHLELNIEVNFEEKQISGTASYRITNKTQADSIYLDTRNLTIKEVTLGENGTTSTGYTLGEKQKHMGRPMAIDIGPKTKWINIQYQTNPDAGALQWLDPKQTEGGEHPYLFTQSQAILARTWIPIQDGPGIRFTYDARVKVPEGLMALMSAENPKQKAEDGVYEFEMKQPIPAYLMALAIGNIEFEPIGEKTGVYTEPGLMKASVHEFGNLDSMMAVAENLWGSYKWGRYDLLVLPPSFPFGGMENPRLSFITPTILAGDRSLTALVAHELAHSWSGNLVTNATWNDFWINEGFTMYAEWRIMEELKGDDYENMLTKLAYQGLEKHMAEIGADNPMTKLHMDLEGQDPDDALTPIPYDKGGFLLKRIEEVFGREKFTNFLKKYFEEFTFETMNSDQFIQYYREHLVKGDTAKANKVAIEEWVYGTGLPKNATEPNSERLQQVAKSLDKWQNGNKPVKSLDTEDWSAHEWQYFLTNLPEQLNIEQMKTLDKAFGFTNSNNSEIQADWYELALKNDYEPAYNKIKAFLKNVGRRKFLTPLYEAMMASGKESMAKNIYEEARPNYHTISKTSIDQIVKKKEGETGNY